MVQTEFEHQRKIIEDDPRKTGLFLGTGSGKTRIALLLARGSTLVIAPKTQVEDRNWEREAKKIGVAVPTVISKETFRRDHAKLPVYDTVIVDEAHTCLGATPNTRWLNRKQIPKTSQLFEALEAYIKRTEPERFYLCTATVLRSPMTVWAAARLLGRDWNFYEFRQAFYVKLPMPGRDVWSAKTDNATKDRLARAVRLLGYTGRLEDYFDVPEQTYQTVMLPLTKDQKDRIKTLSLLFPDPLGRLTKQHQVEQGVLLGDEYTPNETFSNEKLNAILEYAVEFPRMVIFAKYREQLKMLERALTISGYTTLTLTGDTKDRGEVIAKANALPACVFLVQSQISAGWELPDYPVMIFASMTYSFVDRIQAEGRILRANALKKNLYITLVTKGGVDEAVAKAIENKKDFDARLYLGV